MDEPAGPVVPEDASQPGGPESPAPRSRTGRNLPAALGVGLGMGGLALVTLFTIKATFLLYMGAALAIALWELSRAFGTRGIRAPMLPVAVGGAATIAAAYFEGARVVLACLALTTITVLAWRLASGVTGYLRDVTAGVFALAYLPLPARFVAFMLAPPDGPRRVLSFPDPAGVLRHRRVFRWHRGRAASDGAPDQPQEDLGGTGRLGGGLPAGRRNRGPCPAARQGLAGFAGWCGRRWPPRRSAISPNR